MWDKNKGDFILSFQGQGYMGVLLEWGREKKKYVILNVYAPCDLNGKKRLWVDILVAKQSVAAEFWCVLGDFNSIMGQEERQRGSGSMSYPGSSEDSMWFNIFLQRLGLSDLPLFGRKFTWVQPNGRCMSRLDRIMVSSNWLEEWGDTNLWALSRDVSDHCPIILRYSNHDWGPKPFRFNNHWLNNKGFKGIVLSGWSSVETQGWKVYIVKGNLKALKNVLKCWNKEVYGELEAKVANLSREIDRLDIKREGEGLSEEENAEQKRYFSEIRLLLLSKDRTLFQRSRARWLKEGDVNTGYFHACINSLKRSNAIVALQSGVGWIEKPLEVRTEVVRHFSRLFSEVEWERPRLDGINFPQLSRNQNESLVRRFLEEEVRCVVEEADGNKSPSPKP
ncbi:cysteine-rich receptor-like protein kinase [Trifolium pratense]|uniref:Cysteine-rich receptor-like protein kinase n=1 Tax=Trifolium pratense TaxID=57577 RepID=A0A2K3MSA9_TRIPR|nr:cysteine-rich receptor-like protein kinase [Trifolium pratense]